MRFPLAYNANGLRTMPVAMAIEQVAQHGYDGIELSLHPGLLMPGATGAGELRAIRQALENHRLPAVCLATGAANLLSSTPFEPSLVSESEAARRQRIDLIRAAIHLAEELTSPVVNLASGFLPPGTSRKAGWQHLTEGLLACLEAHTGVILAIEPEPGMFVQTTAEAIELIRELDHPRLALNLDVGHVQCVEENLLEAVTRSVPYARHIHIEDIRAKKHYHEIPGTGDLDLAAVFKVLHRGGYRHYLSVELYNHAEAWRQALSQSHAYLSHLMQADDLTVGRCAHAGGA